MNTYPQPSLFDAAEGERLREESIANVTEGANAEWMERAREGARRVAETCPLFTSDFVADWMHANYPNVRTRDTRAMGAIMRELTARGIAEPTSEFRNSENPVNHRRPMRVWRSLVCG